MRVLILLQKEDSFLEKNLLKLKITKKLKQLNRCWLPEHGNKKAKGKKNLQTKRNKIKGVIIPTMNYYSRKR